MPKRHRSRHRTMKGGFLETLSEWGSSISQGASDLWKKTKDTTTSSMTTSSSSNPTYQTPTYQTPTTSTTTMGYGGRRRRTKRRRMRGGFEDNTPVTGLSANAASFSGPSAHVGGRTRRRHRRKTRRH